MFKIYMKLENQLILNRFLYKYKKRNEKKNNNKKNNNNNNSNNKL